MPLPDLMTRPAMPRSHPTRGPRRWRGWLAAVLAPLCVLGPLGSPTPAEAAAPTAVSGDLLIANHSFEAGGEGWSARDDAGRPATCALTTTTRWSDDGRHSLVLGPRPGCGRLGALSAPRPLPAGVGHLSGFATVQGRGAAAVGLVFLDPDGAEVGRTMPDPVGPGSDPRGWREGRIVQVSAEVPRDAAQVQVALRAGGEVNVDTVLVTPAVTTVGSPVRKSASYLASEVGVDADGRSVIFSVATGAESAPPLLVVTDTLTRAVRQTVPLPGATGSWTVRQDPTTQTVYVGTYGSPLLFSWQPGEASARTIGELPITGAGMVYSIDHARDGRIYGGTWGDLAGQFAGAQLWTYTPGGQIERFGPVLTTDAAYTRAVAYEDRTGTVWAGTETVGHLYGCTEDGRCTDFTDLLGPKTRQHLGVYTMIANDGYVVAWGGDSNSRGEDELTVIKVEVVDGQINAEQVAVIDQVIYSGSSDVHDGRIHYVTTTTGPDRQSWSYDLATGVATRLSDVAGIGSRSWRIVELDDPQWPGATMVGWTSSGTIFRRNLPTDRVDQGRATGQPTMPTQLNSLTVGPDGRIWAAGYLTGGLGVVDTMRSDTIVSYAVGGQAESMTTHQGRIYQGSYPNGRIDSFAPTPGTTPSVRVDCTIGASQNRPYGTLGHGDRVYFGSQGGYGHDKGAFGWLDLTTGACTTLSEQVGHYSVNELAASGTKVYGAMNIFFAYDATPIETEAGLLVFDETTGELTVRPLPVPGLKSVDALTTAADGTVWAYANGWVFAIDPTTDEVVLSDRLFSDVALPDRIGGNYADLVTGPDGTLYGRVGPRIFSIDPVRARADGSVADAHRVLWQQASKDLVVDRYGNLYTTWSDQLVRIDPRGIPA